MVERIEPDHETGCWTWTGPRSGYEYGRLYLLGPHYPAHRAVYELLVERVPEDYPVDHLCRNPICVNPDHLEPVTDAVNTQRGLVPVVNVLRGKAKTHCAQGHEYTPENTQRDKRGNRRCGACNRERAHRWRENRSKTA